MTTSARCKSTAKKVMTFDEYDALMAKYETKELKSEGYSFTEDDLEIINEYDRPEEFVSYLIFLSTKPLISEDKKRLEKLLYNLIELVDDKEEA